MIVRVMKTLLIVIASIMYVPEILAQGIIVYKSDGTTERISYAAIDSIVTYADYKDEANNEKEEDDKKPGDSIHEAVDLGLSVKWATCNVGASSPEEYGDYFAWGEIEPKSDYSEENYKYYNSDTKEYIYIGDDISGTEYDAAHVRWGDGWRMPTKDEVEELYEKCTWRWSIVNGVSGQVITGTNGNSIFLPAAGYYDEDGITLRGSFGSYWSSLLGSIYEIVPNYANILSFYSEGNGKAASVRHHGNSIRPVKE